jgi:hypothetical protein
MTKRNRNQLIYANTCRIGGSALPSRLLNLT